jgi:hypothetical protein
LRLTDAPVGAQEDHDGSEDWSYSALQLIIENTGEEIFSLFCQRVDNESGELNGISLSNTNARG